MSQSAPPAIAHAHPSGQLDLSVASYLQRWLKLRSGAATKLWTAYTIGMLAIFVYRISWLLPGGIELRQIRGEYFNFRIPLNKAFFWTHLAAAIPGGLLAAIQFVPRIRARAINLHRNVGKVVNVLSFVSTLAGWGMARVSLGGDLSTTSCVYLLGVLVLWSVVKSWVAIRRLQLDEHRTWIIRAWSYQAMILTDRVVITALIIYVSMVGGYYSTFSCDEVAYILNNQDLYMRDFPQCQANWPGSPVTHVSIEANPEDGTGLGLNASPRVAFGASLWISLLIHVIGAEYYLYRTKDESERLREVSIKRQNLRSKRSSK
ncbi:hypothetical protein FRC12_020121 [Ceratobasidium sp. 428]|nr:hypothetical protein FRC12_020121 [Ceratobasidium sp. 428]